MLNRNLFTLSRFVWIWLFAFRFMCDCCWNWWTFVTSRAFRRWDTIKILKKRCVFVLGILFNSFEAFFREHNKLPGQYVRDEYRFTHEYIILEILKNKSIGCTFSSVFRLLFQARTHTTHTHTLAKISNNLELVLFVNSFYDLDFIVSAVCYWKTSKIHAQHFCNLTTHKE